MKVTHEQAVAVLLAAQFESAADWGAKKVKDKINKLDESVDDDTELKGDKETKALTKKVLKALAKEEAIEVAAPVEEEAAPAPKGKAAKAGKAKPAPVEEEEEDEEEEDADEEGDDEEEEEEKVPVKKKAEKKPAKKDGKAIKAPVKEKAPPKEKKDTIPGVRMTRSRPYLAGIIIKQHMAEAGANGKAQGLKCGVTDAMRDELDAAIGKENPVESMFALRNAWAAIRGYSTKGNEGDLEETEGDEE